MSKRWLVLVAFMTFLAALVDVYLGGGELCIVYAVPFASTFYWFLLCQPSYPDYADEAESRVPVYYINPATGLLMQQPDSFAGFDAGGHMYGFND